MESQIMTRKASTKDLESKLKQALHKLKSSQDLCKQLLQEREDSEVEISTIIKKNSDLKNELAELHTNYLDVVAQRDQLNDVVGTFDQCSIEHERALDRISELEIELQEAKASTLTLNKQKECNELQKISCLYDELVDCNAQQFLKPVVIDLTKDDSCARQDIQNISFSTHNKLKKYIKLNKFIKKTNRMINFKFSAKKMITLRNDNSKLIKKLECYNNKLKQSRYMYDLDTLQLQSEIDSLHSSLRALSEKYESSQNEIREHILAANNLVDLCNYNVERFESLTNKHSCGCAVMESTESSVTQTICNSEVVGDSGMHTLLNKNLHVKNYSRSSPYNIIVISDKLGQGFGSLLNYHFSNVFNACSPGVSYQPNIDKIMSMNVNEHSTIVLLHGNSLSVGRQDVVKSIENLLKLHSKSKCKFVICSFPYSSCLTDRQNRYIYNLNMTLYNATQHHSDAIFYLDLNKFIYNSCKLTEDTLYLPLYFKKQIATLVAYNIRNPAIHCITKEIVCNNNFSLKNNNDIISSSLN